MFNLKSALRIATNHLNSFKRNCSNNMRSVKKETSEGDPVAYLIFTLR